MPEGQVGGSGERYAGCKREAVVSELFGREWIS